VRQLRTGWDDGPAYITQCPIQTGQSYAYNFTITGQRGTLWWHAHILWLRATMRTCNANKVLFCWKMPQWEKKTLGKRVGQPKLSVQQRKRNCTKQKKNIQANAQTHKRTSAESKKPRPREEPARGILSCTKCPSITAIHQHQRQEQRERAEWRGGSEGVKG
jgi:hypothetical protein